MARELARGQVWMYEFHKPNKRRPVVILTRDDAIPVLHSLLVAPVTSVIRGAPSEVRVGVEEGLKIESVVALDNVQCVERSRLEHYVGALGPDKMAQVCHALALATGCD